MLVSCMSSSLLSSLSLLNIINNTKLIIILNCYLYDIIILVNLEGVLDTVVTDTYVSTYAYMKVSLSPANCVEHPTDSWS